MMYYFKGRRVQAEGTGMPGRIQTIDDIVAATIDRFEKSELTLWEVVDDMLRKIGPDVLQAIYRQADRERFLWCWTLATAEPDVMMKTSIVRVADLVRRSDVFFTDVDVYRVQRLLGSDGADWAVYDAVKRARRGQ